MKTAAEALIDRCYAMLNSKYKEFYGRNFASKEPQYRFILSHDELMMLRLHSATLAVKAKVLTFNGNAKETLFGHEVQEQKHTPYLEAISQ